MLSLPVVPEYSIFEKLESATVAPINYFNYMDADVVGCPAAYAFRIIQAHAFADGNKRTGHYACKSFLLNNKTELNAPKDELYQMYIGIASGKLTRDQAKAMLREWTTFP